MNLGRGWCRYCMGSARRVVWVFPVLLGLTGCTIVMAPKSESEVATAAAEAPTRREVLDQRRVLVFGDITPVVAERVVRELFYLDAKSGEAIDFYLMTPGGDLKAAFTIENAMQLLRSPVNTYAFAECNSAGAMLLAAGTGRRVAFRGSTITIHGMNSRGKPPAQYMESVQAYYTDFWRRRARLPEGWLPLPKGQTHFLTADQAREYGLVDSVLERKELPREIAPERAR
ncbi:MAG: ATP-dependent Clp protease proteolytic subunit [Verrucomicrobiales bacterium]|nr:ATP-dependent Clp protease proteolytic subunit [Verrucomicrobiales bacterium]